MKRFPARSPRATSLRTLLVLSFAALLLLPTGCATRVDDDAEPPLVTGHEYFQRGQALHARGKDEQAIAAYSQAIEQDSSFVAAYIERGYLKRNRGDLAGAAADFDRAIFYNPTHIGALFNRADLRRATGDLDGALADFNEILRYEPIYANALAGRAAIEIERGQLESAMADLKRALQSDPRNSRVVAALEKARKAGATMDHAAPPEQEKSVFELGLLTQLPRMLFRTPPQYPPELQKKGITGEVVVEFIVTSRGDVVNGHAVRATHAGFVAPALAVISGWKFYPGMKNGRPVNSRMQQTISFGLVDEPKKK